ncbi:hypothetical protein PENSPDRAFT_685794 [Peniophora sp. CONT]|nr:hypothetical protein PENSPDRAFT_685794 [Peniophora sp. CONT]
MKNFVLHASTRLRAAAQLAPRVLVSLKGNRRKQALPPVSATAVSESSPLLMTDIAPSPNTTVVTGGKARRRKARAITKDALFFSLEALAQSADAFPPLKSAVCGLLFFASQVELVSGNKAQISDIYAQIDAFAESLVRAIPDATALSPALEAAIEALANDVKAVCSDIKAIERPRWYIQFLRAKQNSAELQGLARRLHLANESFTRTVLTSAETKTTQILGSVQLLREDIYMMFRRVRNFFF